MGAQSLSEATETGLRSATGIARMSINQLPVEVLSKAFAYLGDDFASRYLELILQLPGVVEYRYVDTPDLGDAYSARLRKIMRRELPCLYLVRVCRRWYNIAISTPELWTCPPIFHEEAASTFIARSSGHSVEWPLVTSQLRASSLADPDRQRALLPVLIPRTRGLLWLHNTDIQETRDEIGRPGHPLSLVEVEQSLNLRTNALQALYVINRGSTQASDRLPEQLSGPPPPYLHTLFIRGRGVRGDHPLFTADLQSLTLTAVASIWDHVDDMLDTIAELTNLETLVLRATAQGSILEILPNNLATLSNQRRVALPKLRVLTLDDRMRSLAAILYSLTVPQAAFRDVTIKIFDDESVAAFSRALDANFQKEGSHPGFQGFEHVYFQVDEEAQSTLVRACLLHSGPGHLALPLIARRSDILSRHAHLVLRTFGHTHEFIAALEILSGTPVVCLHGVGHEVVSHMHNIRWLSVDQFFAARFVSEVAQGHLDGTLASGLAVLQLEGAVFATDGESPEAEGDPEPINMRLLLPWLANLLSKGKFRLLCLFDCRIKHIMQITSLKAVIGEEHLYWDGVLGGSKEGASSAEF